jgi:hypothetical protein
LWEQNKKYTKMKKYIVHTESSWSFAIAAANYREALATGRRICRHSGEKFTRVRIVK